MKRGGFFFVAILILLQSTFSSNTHTSAQQLESTMDASAVAETVGPPAPSPSGTVILVLTETPTLFQTALDTPSMEATSTPSPFATDTPTATETQTATETTTSTATVTATETPSATLSLTLSSTVIETPPATETLTPSPTETETVTATPSTTASPSPSQPELILISEVAWAGTAASANDEWIELWNPSGGAVDLAGWMLTDGGDIHIALSGTIDPGAFFLLERTDDTTVRDIPADIIYVGSLSNSGERLSLYDSLGRLVDSANADGGIWPAGSVAGYASMERVNAGAPVDSNWCTNAGLVRNGLDANGNPIRGTPHMAFSGFCGTLTPSPTPSPSPTPTLTPTTESREYPAFAIVINELAWAGTAAGSSDEWMELHNPGSEPIDLNGWFLTDDGDIHILLGGWIPAGGFFLLERGDDNVVSDIPTNQVYTGSLSNNGEGLRLIDPSGHVVDAAGAGGSNWPAGTASPGYATMERMGVNPAGWATNNGWMKNGRDSQGQPIRGTPGRANSVLFPTPTPTALPKGVRINEFLPKPGSDWNRDGIVDLEDEFIELINTGPVPVDLTGWMIDDVRKGGSRAYTIPNGVVLQPGQLWVFFRKKTHISLNDGGDEVWLLSPDGGKVDGVVYTKTRWPDSAWNRYPDGESVLRLGFPPTPGEKNRLPPELLLAQRKTPPPALEGWREVECEADGPIVLGDGSLTTGEETSFRMAENTGWLTWEEGGCFAWTAPRTYDGNSSADGWRGRTSGDVGVGWWWEAWFLR